MIYLRSLTFNIFFYISVIIGALVTLIFAPFSFKIINFWWAKVNMPFARWLLKLICGLDIEVRGTEFIPEKDTIFCCKHQSALETYMFIIFAKNITYILKKELTYIPIFGWAVKAYRCVYIDRKAGTAAMKKLLRESVVALKNGRNLLIFPEGTRTKPGHTVEYKPGVAFLYQNLDARFVPVATNTGLFWGKDSIKHFPGKVIFEFMPELPKGLDKRAFLNEMQKRIEDKSRELNEETFKNYPDAKLRMGD